jgi:hypothetical protein
MEWAIAHNLFIRFFEAFLSKHILVVREPQIHLLLLTAKWYHFQPKTWYIIQPVHASAFTCRCIGLFQQQFHSL